jgi:hypothetical protein
MFDLGLIFSKRLPNSGKTLLYFPGSILLISSRRSKIGTLLPAFAWWVAAMRPLWTDPTTMES